MKTKIIPTVLFIALFYVLPLIPQFALLANMQLLFIIMVCITLLLTQPAMSIDESKENKPRDKSSIWFIMGSVALIQLFMVTEWAYFRDDFLIFKWDFFSIFGLILIVFGSVFRLISIKTLGRYFTATVRTQNDQKIIKTGIYKRLRHPSYLGAYLAVIGTTVFMHAYYSIVFSSLVMLLAYVYRIKVEEIALVEDFGEQYKSYQKETNRMVPLVY